MRKITLILGLVMLFPALGHAAKNSDAELEAKCGGHTYFRSSGGKITPVPGSTCDDQSPLRDPKDASPAERKLLNGDSEGKPGPVPDGDDNDHGSSGCKDDDCEDGN